MRTSVREGDPSAAGGFTLVELLVVLAILATLATLAVRSVGPIEQRARFEATQRVLREVESSILGDVESSGEALRYGIVADLGGLPNEVGSFDEPLRALWELPPGVDPSAVHRAADDPEVQLASGWRGPYLSLMPGSPPTEADPTLRDGWGFQLEVVSSPAVFAVISRGADGIPGETVDAYDQDLALALVDTEGGIDRVRAGVHGTVTIEGELSPGQWQVVVLGYSPDPATGKLTSAPSERSDLPATLPATIPYKLAGLTVGPRALRAYVFLQGTEPTDAGGFRSVVRYISLLQGAQAVHLHVGVTGG